MCLANFPLATNIKTDGTLLLWAKEFDRIPEDLFITAVISCINFCKMFPTVSDIRQAIKDLQYEEQAKPKQLLPWNATRDEKIAKKVFEMVEQGKAKEYLYGLNIGKLVEYAKDFFPDISDELVLRNYPEFVQGLEQQNKCFACRTMKQVCDGWLFKHLLDSKTGYVSNQMARCQKNIKQDRT